jgi:hypothetical protein
MELEKLRKLLGIYLDKSILIEKRDLGDSSFFMERLEEVGLNIKNKLNEIINWIKLPKDFLELVKKLVTEEKIKLQLSFAEPYLEDFMNRVFLDLKKYNLLNDQELVKLKEEYSKEGVSFY